MSQEKKYDPANIQQYFGTEFVTANSTYYIDTKGKFRGRPSINGRTINLIAGIDHKYFQKVVNCFYTPEPELTKELETIIKQEGQEVKPGLHLVISLKPDYTSLSNKTGFITSLIKKI